MSSEAFWIDVHAHLQDAKFAGEEQQIVENALKAGVKRIINAATCLETSLQAIELAKQFSCCRATVGIHPHDASSFKPDSIAALRSLAAQPGVVAIGEIGLDFHYDFSPRDVQEKVFRELWLLAAELQMPAVIHIREAFDRFFPVIAELPPLQKVLLHCFSGDIDVARKAADMGFHFSIGGALTFPKSDSTRAVFTFLPIDRIHLETDCPYLAPQPKRGKRNEPALLPITFSCLATLRKISAEVLKQQLLDNAVQLFGD